MKAVIQCAMTKNEKSATFTMNGAAQTFVATPSGVNEVRPWDEIPTMIGKTWIDCAHAYGIPAEWVMYKDAGIGISGNGQLTECGTLYLPRKSPRVYQDLVEKLGKENVYILSAGWGLVRADARIPTYNVTFNEQAPLYAQVTPENRSKYPAYSNVIAGADEIHLFITPNYFDYWTRSFMGKDNHRQRYVLHWKDGANNRPENIQERNIHLHELGKLKTNWQYAAVYQFIKGVKAIMNTSQRSDGQEPESGDEGSLIREEIEEGDVIDDVVMPPVDKFVGGTQKIQDWVWNNILKPNYQNLPKTIRAGDIHTHLKLKQQMTQVCGALRGMPKAYPVHCSERREVKKDGANVWFAYTRRLP